MQSCESPAEPTLLLLDEVRRKTLRLLDGLDEEAARWAPPGLHNSILWHAGHAYCVVEWLTADALQTASELPADWFAMFSWDSEPATVPSSQWPRLGEVIPHLESQYLRLRELFGKTSASRLAQLCPDGRSARQIIFHALADEAAHHGEIWLLRKMLASRQAAGASG